MDNYSQQVFLGHICKPAGWHLALARLTGFRAQHVAKPNSCCMNCGSDDAIFFPYRIRADFDYKILPWDLRKVFAERAVGYCRKCGFGQEFNRFNSDQLERYINIVSSKDHTVSEEAYHTFPIPQKYKDFFNNAYYSKRIKSWDHAIDNKIEFSPQRVLILRPMFGAATQYFKNRFGAECYAMEISKIARMTIEQEQPNVQFLNGNIHAHFYGSFLDTGPYDAVICLHTLVHCIDIHDSLSKIRKLLKPGGFAIFTDEIVVKPSNPFHMIFADEMQWRNLFAQHFKEVVRLEDCQDNPEVHISRYTLDGTSPDYFCIS
jgi:SAM-dependent methyltransferase